ncbi:MAG TPA: hypothetical protein PKA03_00895 [Tabrizicola sp.]|nr:hypothetical protein [Tabrizicola sp.]
MTDPMILIPVIALTVPGILAYGFGRALRSLWPGLILTLAALGSGMFFMSQAAGAQWNDGGAVNNLFAAFGISLPALVSVLIGGALAYVRQR